MIDIFLMTFLISLVTMGARVITNEEMIGEPIREYALKFGDIAKPIITCCVCMPSLWGVGLHFWMDVVQWQYLPLEILSASFLNAFLWRMYQ